MRTAHDISPQGVGTLPLYPGQPVGMDLSSANQIPGYSAVSKRVTGWRSPDFKCRAPRPEGSAPPKVLPVGSLALTLVCSQHT